MTSTVLSPQHFVAEVALPAPPVRPRNLAVAIPGWIAAVVVGFALVAFGLGPLFHQRDQRSVQKTLRHAIDVAANESTGLGGVTVQKHAADVGVPVAMLEIGDIRLQQGVVEGVSSAQTRRAPGHVTGTAGLGQPGNAVVVARAHMFGGSFGSLARLKAKATVVVSTTQGQSLYAVTSVRKRRVDDALFAATKDNRLTLVTSASPNPFNTSRATVVVAKLQGTPFSPTPQGTLRAGEHGTHGDGGVVASLILAVVGYAGVMAGGVYLYGRLRARTAYLLTIGPALAVTVMAVETLSRMLPAWA